MYFLEFISTHPPHPQSCRVDIAFLFHFITHGILELKIWKKESREFQFICIIFLIIQTAKFDIILYFLGWIFATRFKKLILLNHYNYFIHLVLWFLMVYYYIPAFIFLFSLKKIKYINFHNFSQRRIMIWKVWIMIFFFFCLLKYTFIAHLKTVLLSCILQPIKRISKS